MDWMNDNFRAKQLSVQSVSGPSLEDVLVAGVGMKKRAAIISFYQPRQ